VVAAVGVSMFGDVLALVPIALHLQEATGSGLVVAAMFVALWSPMFFLAAPAGLLVDRREPRRVLLVAVLAQAVVACALAFTSSTAAILVLTALLGAGAAVAQPAEFALIPSVAAGDVRRANSYVETARGLGFGLGPLAGGLLAAVGGMRVGLLVDAATFLFVAGVSLVLPCYTCGGRVREHVGRARDGALYLARDGVLRLVLGVGFVSLLFMTAVAPAEVFFAKDVLGAGDLGYGLMLGAWTMGMTLADSSSPGASGALGRRSSRSSRRAWGSSCRRCGSCSPGAAHGSSSAASRMG
jgi:MFS family permease